jgi:PHD/YefM family antitoxin component YafN of YafNO toxin-antitoxin module
MEGGGVGVAITTLSSREFNQRVGYAKKAAETGPVFITDRGEQTHVLLNVEEYRKITGAKKGQTLYEALYDPGLASIDEDFEFARIEGTVRPAEFD